MIEFGREVCNDLDAATRREWLVTNGIGGYASGTVAGVQTRRYHGLLIAALEPPLARTLLLAKFDETARYHGRAYPLFANHWASGQVEPHGYHFLDRFHLDGTTPVWTFSLAEALLEKRVWMQPGRNTTCVQYTLARASAPLHLTIKAFANYRDHHRQTDQTWAMGVEPLPRGPAPRAGVRLLPPNGGTPFVIFADRADATPHHEWHLNYYLAAEAYRGLPAVEHHLHIVTFTAELAPGASLTLIASAEPDPVHDVQTAWEARRRHEQALLERFGAAAPLPSEIRQLALAADQFIVCRPSSSLFPGEGGAAEENGHTVIAGYPWFEDWGRDTMISLSGLTLSTGRPEIARSILRTFARHINQGMLPNRFPEMGAQPEYNTADATLWYFEAIRAYQSATQDDALLRELYPILEDILAWHARGTRYGIRRDPADGLLYAGEPGVQLTWMDAKVEDWVVTPRAGKPVEINALWYNANCAMAGFARRLGKDARPWAQAAEKTLAGFARFWNSKTGYCFDLLDGPDGHDPTLRPNQLLAVSLAHSPLPPDRQKAVVDACARHLYTPHGLRSLAPGHPDYVGVYGGDQRQRDASYHQGTVWGWLAGPFTRAHLRVYRDPERAASFLQPLIAQIRSHGVGSLSEIFDGDAPFTPRGCIAQAWSVAEVLQAWCEIESLRYNA